MPNPLPRQRRTAESVESAEVSQLKKELADLKANYSRDVSLISADIRQIASQIAGDSDSTNEPQT